MNSKSSVAAIVGRLKPKAPSRRLEFTMAITEIAQALNIQAEPAAMMLYGLCATGNVRWFDAQGELIHEDECTIADFNHKPALVVVDDVRHWLAEWSKVPQPLRREAVITALLAEGLNPPRNIKWKEFYKRVRDECNARLDAKGRASFSFSDKTIWRTVKDLRSK